MPISSNPVWVPTSISASGLIKTGQGAVRGFVVSSTTAGTVKLWDNTSAAGTVILDTITPAAAQVVTLDAGFANGLYVTLGGTITLTILYV